LDEIIDHAKDNTAVTIADGYTMSYNGKNKWWKDGSYYVSGVMVRLHGFL
jgi:hypothetical protein